MAYALGTLISTTDTLRDKSNHQHTKPVEGTRRKIYLDPMQKIQGHKGKPWSIQTFDHSFWIFNRISTQSNIFLKRNNISR